MPAILVRKVIKPGKGAAIAFPRRGSCAVGDGDCARQSRLSHVSCQQGQDQGGERGHRELNGAYGTTAACLQLRRRRRVLLKFMGTCDIAQRVYPQVYCLGPARVQPVSWDQVRCGSVGESKCRHVRQLCWMSSSYFWFGGVSFLSSSLILLHYQEHKHPSHRVTHMRVA